MNRFLPSSLRVRLFSLVLLALIPPFLLIFYNAYGASLELSILVLATAWLGNHAFVLKRIRSLVNASRRLAAGNLNVRSGLAHEQDKIGKLASAFDQMANALKAREAEREQAEQTRAQLAAIVESSNDAIIGRTVDGIITSWNKGAERLYGYSAEEAIGQPITILASSDQPDRIKRNFETIKRGERVEPYETVRLRKDGRPIHVSVGVSPVLDVSGKIVGVSSITWDITERKRAGDRIKALHDINLAVTSTLDLATILQILLEKIDVLLPYAAAHIRLVNKSTGHIEPIACHNIDQAKWKAGAEAIQHSIHRTIVQSKRPMILRNLQQDERVSRKDFYRQHGLVSYIGLPLIVKEEVIGVLSLLTKEQHEFTGEEIAFAETLAKQASVAIHNSQLYEQSKKLSQDLLANERQIRALVSGLIYAQDDEAKRIARALHDESGQLLATVYIALDEMAKETPTAKKPLEKIKGLLDQIEERLRNLSHELHPTILDHLGLLPSFEFLAQQISKRTGIQVTIEGATNKRFSPLLELTLYRVAQEALNNAARHSHASKVHVRLRENERLIQCALEDNGIGFDPKAISGWPGRMGSGLGLAGMRERIEALNGTFQVLSAPGQGTKLAITIPKERIHGSANSSGR